MGNNSIFEKQIKQNKMERERKICKTCSKKREKHLMENIRMADINIWVCENCKLKLKIYLDKGL